MKLKNFLKQNFAVWDSKMRDVLPMTVDTLPQAYRIFQAQITECWSVAEFEKELQNPLARVLVCVEDQTVLGFVQLRHIAGEGQLLNIAVAEQAKHQGVGRCLITGMQTLAKQEQIEQVVLEVRSQNSSALAFYEALGFERIGKRRGFYQHPVDDALLYRLTFE